MLLFPMIAASLVFATNAEANEAAAAQASRERRGSTARSHPESSERAAVGSGGATASRHAALRADRLRPHGPAALLASDEVDCPRGMVSIAGSFCIDAYEASLVQVLPGDRERPWPYFEAVPTGVVVRAVSARGVYPQGYVSGVQARDACERSGKRLCKPDEWRMACMGPDATVFPYGNERQVGRCNDNGRSSMRFFNPELDDRPEHKWMWGRAGNMLDPRLNQLPGTLTRTGERAGCTNAYGVYDMVGNLHEWVDDAAGTFQGGYYLDTHINGDGCYYRTTAHPIEHRDYSTGFRCCADPPAR